MEQDRLIDLTTRLGYRTLIYAVERPGVHTGAAGYFGDLVSTYRRSYVRTVARTAVGCVRWRGRLQAVYGGADGHRLFPYRLYCRMFVLIALAISGTSARRIVGRQPGVLWAVSWGLFSWAYARAFSGGRQISLVSLHVTWPVVLTQHHMAQCHTQNACKPNSMCK